eukprot:760560-Hanusia_phi.AAC.1
MFIRRGFLTFLLTFLAAFAPQPIFAQPNGREIWVLLLEKAFAKPGGHILWAFQAMTGDNVMQFSREDDKSDCSCVLLALRSQMSLRWCRYDMRQPTDENNKRRIGLRRCKHNSLTNSRLLAHDLLTSCAWNAATGAHNACMLQ